MKPLARNRIVKAAKAYHQSRQNGILRYALCFLLCKTATARHPRSSCYSSFQRSHGCQAPCGPFARCALSSASHLAEMRYTKISSGISDSSIWGCYTTIYGYLQSWNLGCHRCSKALLIKKGYALHHLSHQDVPTAVACDTGASAWRGRGCWALRSLPQQRLNPAKIPRGHLYGYLETIKIDIYAVSV